jgi:hypothetical protein
MYGLAFAISTRRRFKEEDEEDSGVVVGGAISFCFSFLMECLFLFRKISP